MQYGCLMFRRPFHYRPIIKENTRTLAKSQRTYAQSSEVANNAWRTRNIGIIAHIDAGKTTTTERMLYYSGHTRRIGDVDEGSTVTDFLPAERARGITIQSAAISFHWPPLTDNGTENDSKILAQVRDSILPRSALPHSINLIDTPGHADFTFEVRRSLRVLDGAVCILDGVAGVEAQTEQVWKQAGAWQIPRLVFVNKLDREGAAFGHAVREVAVKLRGWPAVCQIPWWEGGKGQFCGIADVVNLCGLLYEQGGDGKTIQHFTLEQLEKKEPSLAEELRIARTALVELLSEHDEELVEAFFEANEDHLAVSPVQLWDSLRRCLLTPGSRVIPIFAGASFRNIGVQPVLDAVNNLLPSPSERSPAEISLGQISGRLDTLLSGEMNAEIANSSKSKKRGTSSTLAPVDKSLKGCALAFKVVNDPRKGVLVYFRVYSGSIDRNALLFNTNLQVSERAATLLRMYANESVPVQSIEAGQIGVIAGSKFARTGDTLISYTSNRATPPEPLDKLQLRPIHIPPPVFFAAIEPNSLREEKDMHDKLNMLLREDPSLQVTQDEDTGQTLLSGMGELHLEIARDRLVGDLKANARMGKIAIGYRETLTRPSTHVTKVFDQARLDAKGKAGCTAMVEPLEDDVNNASKEAESEHEVLSHHQDGNLVVVAAPSLDHSGRPIDDDTASLPGHLTLREISRAYLNGALAALSRGPTYSYPMRQVKITLTLDPTAHVFGNETTYSALTAAARMAGVAAFRDATATSSSSSPPPSRPGVVAPSKSSALMEPVMNVDISVDEDSLGRVVQDISSRMGGHISSLDGDGQPTDSSSTTEPSTFDNDPEDFTIDVSKIYAPKDPFETANSSAATEISRGLDGNRPRMVKARIPLKEMVGYLKYLRSMTGGRGTFTMSVDRFERVTGAREKTLIAELRGME